MMFIPDDMMFIPGPVASMAQPLLVLEAVGRITVPP
jgi:hypothetical protein